MSNSYPVNNYYYNPPYNHWAGGRSDSLNKWKINYKGSIAKASDLPNKGEFKGDTYNVLEDGSNYMWNGSSWDKLDANIYIGATNAKNGIQGLVPPATPSERNKVLKGDATWSDISWNDITDKPTITGNTTQPSFFECYSTTIEEKIVANNSKNDIYTLYDFATNDYFPESVYLEIDNALLDIDSQLIDWWNYEKANLQHYFLRITFYDSRNYPYVIEIPNFFRLNDKEVDTNNNPLYYVDTNVYAKILYENIRGVKKFSCDYNGPTLYHLTQDSNQNLTVYGASSGNYSNIYLSPMANMAANNTNKVISKITVDGLMYLKSGWHYILPAGIRYCVYI